MMDRQENLQMGWDWVFKGAEGPNAPLLKEIKFKMWGAKAQYI